MYARTGRRQPKIPSKKLLWLVSLYVMSTALFAGRVVTAEAVLKDGDTSDDGSAAMLVTVTSTPSLSRQRILQ